MAFRSIRKAMEPNSLVSRRNEVVPSARVRVRESTIVTVGNLGAFAFGVFAREHDWDGRGCRFSSQCRGRPSRRDDNCYLAADQIGRQCWQSIVLPLRRAVLDRDVLTLRIASFLKALAECSNEVRRAFN